MINSKRTKLITMLTCLGVSLALVAAIVNPATASVSTQLQTARDNLANCQLLLASSRGSQAQRQWARDCVAVQQNIIALLTTPSPSAPTTPTSPPVTTSPPSPTSPPTSTAAPTVPATTPPTTHPPATTSPPATTQPPMSTPTPTPSPTVGPVIHGRDISQDNTGYLAWHGPNGERCTDATLTVYAAKMRASQLTDTTCIWLKQGITVDVPVTLVAAKIDTIVRSDGPELNLEWSTVDGHGDGTYSIGGRNVNAKRSQIVGSSDAIRLQDMEIQECWIRVVSTSADDHNDAIQAYQASAGGVIVRSNIDGRPIGGPTGVFGNAAIFLADNSRGTTIIRDNLLAGGGYTLRLHESQHYQVTGNVVVSGSWGYGPLSTTNAVSGAFEQWTDNVTSAGMVLRP